MSKSVARRVPESWSSYAASDVRFRALLENLTLVAKAPTKGTANPDLIRVGAAVYVIFEFLDSFQETKATGIPDLLLKFSAQLEALSVGKRGSLFKITPAYIGRSKNARSEKWIEWTAAVAMDALMMLGRSRKEAADQTAMALFKCKVTQGDNAKPFSARTIASWRDKTRRSESQNRKESAEGRDKIAARLTAGIPLDKVIKDFLEPVID